MPSSAESELEAIEERIDARRARASGLARLGELFGDSTAPDPPLEGFLSGRPLALSRSPLLDAWGRRLGELYMPWLGKRFESSAGWGINVLARSARLPLRVLWPSYVAERELADRIEAFSFRTRAGSGELDPATDVLKIDYDLERNPDLVRRLLDEVVQLDRGLYLGKSLVRGRAGWRELGYFVLSSGEKTSSSAT